MGREIALADIRGSGGGMDPGTYCAHAYEKGMTLLAMAEDGLGRKNLDAVLRGFVADHCGGVVGWSDFRKALAKGVARPWSSSGRSSGSPRLL